MSRACKSKRNSVSLLACAYPLDIASNDMMSLPVLLRDLLLNTVTSKITSLDVSCSSSDTVKGPYRALFYIVAPASGSG